MTETKPYTEGEVKRLNGKVPELMGATEVAAELGTKQSNLAKIVGLPAHAQELERGRVWRGDVIRRFAQARRERIVAEGLARKQAAEEAQREGARARAQAVGK